MTALQSQDNGMPTSLQSKNQILMVPQKNTQIEPPLPKLVSNAEDDTSGSHLSLVSSAMVRFVRPEEGKPKAKTPQYQAPRDLIDDEIDSSVEFTDMSPSV
jgi:hypothetical protein